MAMQDLALCSLLGRICQMHTSSYKTVHWHIKQKPVHNNSPSLVEELPAALTKSAKSVSVPGKGYNCSLLLQTSHFGLFVEIPCTAEKTGQITALTYGMLSAQHSQQDQDKGG